MSYPSSTRVDVDELTVSRAIELFKSIRLSRLSENTRIWYQPKLREFVYAVGSDRPLSTIKEFDLDIYVSSLYDPRPLHSNNPNQPTRIDTYSPATIYNHCKAIKSLFAWLRRKRYIERNPAEVIEMPDLKRQPVQPIPHEDLEKLKTHFKQAGNIRNLSAITLLAATGIRAGEFASIGANDISLFHKWVRVLGKGSKERIIPFDQRTAHILQKYDARKYLPRHVDAFFLSWENNRDIVPMSKKALQLMIKRGCKAAGIPHYTPHQFRHRFATDAVTRGASTPWLQLMLGHEIGSSATKVYVHNNVEVLRAEYDRLFPVEK